MCSEQGKEEDTSSVEGSAESMNGTCCVGRKASAWWGLL